ncbi:hypothetical protein AAG596_04305 [Citromicrobium bathyomarinum]|uniref:hypothetical protein n=1 Tax=Citromicrobium bathyomarinum TaxID=72174 RepID=UPI00315A85B7
MRDQIRSDICEFGEAIQTIGDWGGRGSAVLIGGGLVAALFTGGSSLSVSALGGNGLMLSGYVSAGGQFVQDLASGAEFGATAGRLFFGTVGGGQASGTVIHMVGDVASYLPQAMKGHVGDLTEAYVGEIAGAIDFLDPEGNVLQSSEILRNHHIAGFLLIVGFAFSYILRSAIPQELGFASFGAAAYLAIYFVDIPIISRNQRLAKFVSLSMIFVGLAAASQKFLPPQGQDIALIILVPLTLFFVIKLYFLIFMREA